MAEQTNNVVFQPPKRVQENAYVSSMEQYREMYKRSVEDPAGFWGEIAKTFYWKTPPTSDKFLEYNFDPAAGPISIKWMQGAVTNISYNVLDRLINENGLGEKIAFYW